MIKTEQQKQSITNIVRNIAITIIPIEAAAVAALTEATVTVWPEVGTSIPPV